jgi:hypothetical protein
MKEVIFWRQLDQTIVAQKDEDFFKFPLEICGQVEADKSLRESVALNFDSAPLKTSGFDIVGAVVIDRILVD